MGKDGFGYESNGEREKTVKVFCRQYRNLG